MAPLKTLKWYKHSNLLELITKKSFATSTSDVKCETGQNRIKNKLTKNISLGHDIFF